MSLNEILLNLFFPKESRDQTRWDSYISTDLYHGGFFKQVDGYDQNSLQVFVAAQYQEKDLRDLIIRSKVDGETAIIKDLAHLLYQNLRSTKVQPAKIPPADLITFVPPDPQRYAKRGYHLPEDLARHLSELSGIPFTALLEKIKTTQSQTNLSRQERLQNLTQAFQITPLEKSLANITTLWIVDDLVTTGSTFRECALVLNQSFPFLKIYGLAIASSQE